MLYGSFFTLGKNMFDNWIGLILRRFQLFYTVFFSKHFLSALSLAQMKIVTHYRQTHFWRSLQNLSNGDELQWTPSQTRRITRKKWKKNASSFFYLFFKRQNTVVLCLFWHDSACIHVQLFLLWAFWRACMTNSSMPNRPHHFWCFVTVFERNNFKASKEKWPRNVWF